MNLFSLSWNNHIGPQGVHVIGDIAFIEKHGLMTNQKWSSRYKKLREKKNIGEL